MSLLSTQDLINFYYNNSPNNYSSILYDNLFSIIKNKSVNINQDGGFPGQNLDLITSALSEKILELISSKNEERKMVQKEQEQKLNYLILIK